MKYNGIQFLQQFDHPLELCLYLLIHYSSEARDSYDDIHQYISLCMKYYKRYY